MINIIVAVAQNGVIGGNNTLLWHISEDLKNFKKLTSGHPIIMGRKTYESLGKPLPNRDNVVITRSNIEIPGCIVVHSLDEAIALYPSDKEVFVIGGAEIYRAALPLADKFYITRVQKDYEGDTYFPEWDQSSWKCIDRQKFARGEKYEYPFVFETYIKPKVFIETYGCQMNVYDSELAMSILLKNGYQQCEDILQADIILVNTCSIRDNAEQRVWGRLDYFLQLRKKKKKLIVGVLGCMGERIKEKLFEHDAVNLVVGPDAYRRLPELLDQINNKKQIDVTLSKEETYDDISPIKTDTSGITAFISIMRGCNNMCTYCIVPYVRGRERSRNPYTIVEEAKGLFEQGFKEVNLLGQNVDSYLWKSTEDPEMTIDFAQLIEMVALVSPELRVRFSTSHPKDMGDAILYTMAKYPNICTHIHLPVQSGSDRMLDKMNRKYTREKYLGRIAKIREIVPDATITTDIIAGFCSETEEDHQDTMSLIKEVGYDSAFMFQYSTRPNTKADRLFEDDVPLETKTRRLNEIIELQNDLSLKSNQKDVGKQFIVLIEGVSKRNKDEYFGRTSGNKVCIFPHLGHEIGEYVEVVVESCTSATLKSKIVKEL